MYIWILLATIMVAFSFYNVAPRADKEHALNEVRAATIVNRFNAEHVAMLRTIECEIIRRTNNNTWDEMQGGSVRSSSSAPVEITKYNPNSVFGTSYSKFAYTEFKDHLPIGYSTGKNYSNNKIKHFVYCLKGNIEDMKDEGTSFVACDATMENTAHAEDLGHHRYLVSVIPVPDRWKAKDGATPLPVLVNLLADIPTKTTIFGWTDCKPDEGCKLHGMGANSANFYDTEERIVRKENGEEAYRMYNVKRAVLDKDSLLWKNDDIMNLCRSTTCILAYERIPWSDDACHCENLVRASEDKTPLSMEECYHTANAGAKAKDKSKKWEEFQKKMGITSTQTNTNP